MLFRIRQHLRIRSRWQRYSALVRFEHTVFALPFALSGVLLASPLGQLPGLMTWVWVVLALLGGRTYAMALNRLADRRIDARNPRTQAREIPAGKILPWKAAVFALVALGVFAGSARQLPPLCWQLWPVAVLLLTLYSYLKRFTVLCHAVLGVCLGCAAVGGWVAVTGSLSGGLPVLLGLAVTAWVLGFDVIYACQDVAFDRAVGLHSLPAWLGVGRALTVSRVSHALCVLCLLGFGWAYRQGYQALPVGYWLAVGAIAVLLVREHRLVRPDDLSRVNEAFFTLNALVSSSLFAGVALTMGWRL